MESSPVNDGDDQNDTGWSHPLTVETVGQQLPTSTRTLTIPSNSPRDSLLMSPPLIPTLPFELITEILCRLPVKFLMTLKCVCKPWNSLISSDRKFARKHLRISNIDPKLILYFTRQKQPEFSHLVYPLTSFFANGNGTIINGGTGINYPLNSEHSSTNIVGSCDGLLCLTQTIFPHITENFTQPALWNPSTRKYTLLPALDKPHPLINILTDSVENVYGFGYDRFTDNYKVVAVRMYKKCRGVVSTVCEAQVMVYTLGTDSWRLIQDFPSIVFGAIHLDSGIFLSGTINWLVPIGDQPIVSIDLGTESYQQILPPDYGKEKFTLKLGVSRDCLCILAGRVDQMVSDIWLMKEYGNRESWTKLVSVPYKGCLDFSLYTNRILYIAEDGQILLENMKDLQPELVVYDPINNTTTIQDIENINVMRISEIYIESLISPCH